MLRRCHRVLLVLLLRGGPLPAEQAIHPIHAPLNYLNRAWYVSPFTILGATVIDLGITLMMIYEEKSGFEHGST